MASLASLASLASCFYAPKARGLGAENVNSRWMCLPQPPHICLEGVIKREQLPNLTAKNRVREQPRLQFRQCTLEISTNQHRGLDQFRRPESSIRRISMRKGFRNVAVEFRGSTGEKQERKIYHGR